MAAVGFGAFVAATYANQAYVKEGEAWTRVQVGDLLYSTHPLSLSARLLVDKARSRLYRSQILQENRRWKALAEIYTMHSFAPFSTLNFFVKNC